MSLDDEKLFKKLDEDEKKWLDKVSDQTAPTVLGFKIKGLNPFKWLLDLADHLLWRSVEEEVLFQQEYERKKAKRLEQGKKTENKNPNARQDVRLVKRDSVDLNKSTTDVANDIKKMLDE